MNDGFIPPHGGYRKLLSYQRSEVVYDATVRFCEQNFDRYDRTFGQMVQAARSGKQNIIEASMASATSKATEIKLTNVARASLEELMEDYRDFLRVRGFEEWRSDHPFAKRLGELVRTPNANYGTFRKAVEHPDFPDRRVEVGGFVPHARLHPPPDLAEALATKHASWLAGLVDMLPRVGILRAEAASRG